MAGLIIDRMPGERFAIYTSDGRIVVSTLELVPANRPTKVVINIQAPPDVYIVREEIDPNGPYYAKE
jgi:sRNA-binding carbon storage regulator CsrA